MPSLAWAFFPVSAHAEYGSFAGYAVVAAFAVLVPPTLIADLVLALLLRSSNEKLRLIVGTAGLISSGMLFLVGLVVALNLVDPQPGSWLGNAQMGVIQGVVGGALFALTRYLGRPKG